MAQQTVNIPWTTGTGNIVCKWDDTDPSPTEVKISSDSTHSSARSQVLTFKAGTAQATLNVSQEASVYTYEFVPSASVETIAASGGDSIVTASLKTYRNGSLINTEIVYPSLEGTSEGFSISDNIVTAANRGTVQGEERSISLICKWVTPETGETLSQNLVISQAANNRVTVYSKPNIVSAEAEDIPASGGTISEATITYSQSRHYYYDSGVTEQLEPLTTGGTINYGDPVTAPSRTYIIGEREIAGTLTFTVSMNGQTSVEQDVSIYQEENEFISWDFGSVDPVSIPYQGTFDYEIPISWTFTSGQLSILDDRVMSEYQISFLIEGERINQKYNENIYDEQLVFNDIQVIENTSVNSISTTINIVISSSDYSEDFAYSLEIPATQEGAPETLSVEPTSLEFEADGGTQELNIDSNTSWNIS